MKNARSRWAWTAAAVAGLAVAGPLALAFGDAANKQPGYASTADSDATFVPEFPLDLVTFGSTHADSATSDDGTESNASATAPTALMLGDGDEVTCGPTTGTEQGGAVRDEKSDGVVDQDLGLATVRVLSASCETTAVKKNNASGSARSSVAEVSVAELDVYVLSTSADAKTTSGSARSERSFGVLEVEDTVVAGCSSSATANNGHPEASDDADVDTAVLGVPLPLGTCTGTSTSTHERTPPSP